MVAPLLSAFCLFHKKGYPVPFCTRYPSYRLILIPQDMMPLFSPQGLLMRVVLQPYIPLPKLRRKDGSKTRDSIVAASARVRLRSGEKCPCASVPVSIPA